ncbi:MAG: hypothetical protein R6X34_20195 [Chloroflexota bacterium]
MNMLNQASQWGGAAFMLGSLLFLVNKLNEMSRLFFSRWMADVISGQDTLLILIGQAAFIIGYVGFWRLYGERVERRGKNALRLICGGGIVLAVGHVSFLSFLDDVVPLALLPYAEASFLLVIVGVLFLVVGLIWFGILNLRHPVLSRWQWLPLVTGLMGFIGFFLFSGEQITAVFLLFRTLFALGLLGMGLLMWLEKPVELEIVV